MLVKANQILLVLSVNFPSTHYQIKVQMNALLHLISNTLWTSWTMTSYGVSNHQPHDCLLNCLFSRRSKKTSKIHVTGLCEENSQVSGEFPTQRASNAENVSIWWRHYDFQQKIPIYFIYDFEHDIYPIYPAWDLLYLQSVSEIWYG